MATITRTTTEPSEPAASSRPASLRGITVGIGLAAAVASTAVAAVLHAAGVSFEIDGEMIPLAAFAQMTFLGAVIGGILAGSIRKRSTQPRTRFLQITIALTVLTCIPSVLLPPEVATKAALVLTHLVPAAIVIPVLARRLAD